MKRKLFIPLIFVVIAIIIGLFTTQKEPKLNSNYEISLKGWVEDVKPVRETNNYKHATYIHDDYYLNGNHFRLTTVEMKHGDILYFAQNNIGETKNKVTLQISANEPTNKKIMSFNHEERKWEEIDSKIKNFSNSKYFDGEQLFQRIGKVDVLTPLGHSVEKVINSSKQTVNRKLGKESVTYSIPLESGKDTFSETWGILATNNIINWDNEDAVWMASNIEFDTNKRLAVDGAYYLTPDSYKPYEENSYYLNPANLDGLRALSHIDTNVSGSIFKNVATHLAYTAVLNQNSHGFWPTLPLSEWLYNDYNIGYAYMDNRRNIDNALFILRYYLHNADPDILKTIENWNEYHLNYMKQHAIKIKNGGILIPDYVEEDGKSEAHSSLNHLAANLNYLLESYLFTKDDEQLKYANMLLLGIKNTKDLWVAPDNNLYYSLSQKLEPNPLDDYLTLTRDDLMETQLLLEKVFGEGDDDIQYLIDSKNIWLNENHP